MLEFKSDVEAPELMNVVRSFFDCDNVNNINIVCDFLNYKKIKINDVEYDAFVAFKEKKYFLRECKMALYKALASYTRRNLPWGGLTGIRPTKLAYELIENGEDVDELKQYCVSDNKIRIVKQIIENQKGLTTSYKKVNFYVHIPFCTSRCSYCSFISMPVRKNEQLMEEYVSCLVKEITLGVQYLNQTGFEVASVYIGGGTPTALSSEQLNTVLDCIPYRGIEYTVEAGRPDTITEEKLDLIYKHGVTRISINPQSFVDKTLQEIGRNHTAEDIVNKYIMAKDRFDINMDIIAGLPGETSLDFSYTIQKTIELRPENVTVHTLSRKNGSEIRTKNIVLSNGVTDMVNYAYDELSKAGYSSYYLYRQKNMLENQENIGYTLPNHRCENNITTMEEFYSVFACGAGAISKTVNKTIERLANLRDVRLYIEQFDERLQKKQKFFSKCC